jgi:putative tryptophan/tyrosine transport system substrate-binding protein
MKAVSCQWSVVGKSVCALALCAMIFALSYSASAQHPKKVPLVAFLSLPSSGPDLRSEAFRQGLREFGYMEGQNIVVEYRWADGRTERLAGLAAELVGMKPDVIVTASTFAAQAVKKATKTIPVVMSGVADVVGTGLVASLARPGGNLTGTTLITPDLMGKQLELLKEIVPRITRVAVLGTTPNPTSGSDLRATREAARILRLQLQVVEVGGPEEFGSAFSEFAKGGCGGLLGLGSPVMVNNRQHIADLTIKHRLPAVFWQKEYAEAGALMAYGSSFTDTFRRAPYFVDRILKGAKPADLPVEQPMKFELVINLKTAKQIGLTIPPNVLARADKVIR